MTARLHGRVSAALTAAFLLAPGAGALAQPTHDQETVAPYAYMRNWDVMAVLVDGNFVGCRGAHYGESGPFMLDLTSEGWRLVASYRGGTDEGIFAGAVLTVDRTAIDTQVGLDLPYWATLYLEGPQLDLLRSGTTASLRVNGQSPVTASLTGSAAMLLKVEECFERTGEGAEVAAAAPAAAPAAAETPADGEVRRWRVGDWQFTRMPPSGESDSNDAFCIADSTVDGEKAVMFGAGSGQFQFGFMSPGFAEDGTEIPVDLWFDGDRATLRTFQMPVVADMDGVDWRIVWEETDRPAIVERFETAASFEVLYSDRGRSVVRYFPLAGARDAIATIAACARE